MTVCRCGLTPTVERRGAVVWLCLGTSPLLWAVTPTLGCRHPPTLDVTPHTPLPTPLWALWPYTTAYASGSAPVKGVNGAGARLQKVQCRVSQRATCLVSVFSLSCYRALTGTATCTQAVAGQNTA